jgi:hypothetical protein
MLIITLDNVKMTVFCVIALYSLAEIYRRSRCACCLHNQGDKTSVNFYQSTRCYNPQDSHLHTWRRHTLNPTGKLFVWKRKGAEHLFETGFSVVSYLLEDKPDYRTARGVLRDYDSGHKPATHWTYVHCVIPERYIFSVSFPFFLPSFICEFVFIYNF